MIDTVFAFVEPSHPFGPQLECFRAAVRREPRCAELIEQPAARVQVEIKGVPTPDGGWALDRFYWSLQAPGRAALTLVYSARTDQLTWHAFPEDPYLPGLARGLGAGGQVLRYVPLRRVTVRTDDGDTIAKFKRRSRLADSYQRLTVVARAVDQAKPSFGVPAPRGLDRQHDVFFQSAQPGEDLALRLDASNMQRHLRRLGAVHRELHELEVARLPAQTVDTLAQLRREADWMTFFRPDCRDLLEACVRWAGRLAPTVASAETAACHGDFVCSQVLVADDRWTVTDFDACHRGDPYRDVAIFLASLHSDVPLFQARPELADGAARAYQAGYEARAGRSLDTARLAWHRLATEVYYLALMFKKDWYQPASFARGLDRLCALIKENV